MPKELTALAGFEDHGIEFYARSGQSEQADCPFCGKERAFHVNPKTTLWVCSSSPDRCGRSGNLVTFLEQWADFCHEETDEKEWRRLSAARDGLPASIFKGMHAGWNPLTEQWIFPVKTARNTIQDLRRWVRGKKSRIMGTSGCKTGLWGLEILAHPAYAGWSVDICEGEWDGGCMRWLNRQIHRRSIVVAVPGARIFKKEWVPYFKGREVIWWYDNDPDGIQYSYKRHFMLRNVAKQQRFVTWPDTFAKGFDVRDFLVGGIIERGITPKKVYYFLRTHVTADHQLADVEKTEDEATTKERPKSNPSIERTLEAYRRWLKMTPDHVDAVKVTYATVLANHWPGSPVWTLLCGPAGYGKTEIIMSLQDVPEVMLESSVSPKTLISGFKMPTSGEDPSLLPKMLNKTTGFKDWTEILDMSEQEQRELYKVLRGAFDGQVIRHYGNGVERIYRGRFGILGGVTNKIHGQSRATVGERFLKFQMPPMPEKTAREVVRAAIMSAKSSDKMKNDLADAARKFLDRDMPDWEPEEVLPEWAIDRIIAVSQLMAMLRHQVEWENIGGGERSMSYKPQFELGTRLAQQLTKFAMAMVVVDGKKMLDKESWVLVERMAFNTGIGFNLDVVEACMELGGRSAEFQSIKQLCRLPGTTLRRRIEDLEALGILLRQGVQRGGGPGRPGQSWKVSKRVSEYWRTLRPLRSHISEAQMGRTKV